MEAWRNDLRPTPKKKLVNRFEAVFKEDVGGGAFCRYRDSVSGDWVKVVFGDVYE